VEGAVHYVGESDFGNRELSSFETNATITRPARSPDGVELTRSQSSMESSEHVSEAQLSPVTTSDTSGLPTPSLPWSDSSLSTFLDKDKTIRDALVLIHEGGRLLKHTRSTINPQIADLYSVCSIHIDEMSTVRILIRHLLILQHLDDVLMSYLFDTRK